MKKKKSGFTLIELVITLALTLVVFSVIYLFSATNTNMLSKAEINSKLQDDSQGVQKELVNIGMQAKEILTIDDKEASKVNYDYYNDANKGKLNCNKFTIRAYENEKDVEYTFEKRDKELWLIKNIEGKASEAKLSSNLLNMAVRPLDINNYTDRSTVYFNSAESLEISVSFNMQKGLNDITYPMTTIVKFRNKDV